MKSAGRTKGIYTRTHADGSQVFSAVLTKRGQHFDRRFPSLEEACRFRREDKLKDALWQFPPLTGKERRALEDIRRRDPLVAPVIDSLLRCSPGSGQPPLGTTARATRNISDPPGRAHSQRPMDPPPDPDVLMHDYARRWFETNTWRWSARAAAQLRSLLLSHLMPDWRARPVRTVTDAFELRSWFETLAKEGLSPVHLKNIRAVFVMLLHAAQTDGLIPANPFSHPSCSRKAIIALSTTTKTKEA